MPSQVKLAESQQEFESLFGVLKELRLDLECETFLSYVNELLEDGYKFAYIAEAGQVACVAGFRLKKNFYMGTHVYVEDLVVSDQVRSSGLGKQMLSWIREWAVSHGCKGMNLDSGVQRYKAHKFYLNQNMSIMCHHFVEIF